MNLSSMEEGNAHQDFKKLTETIGTNIQKISQNVSSMKKLVNQLKSSQESYEIWNQYNQIQNYTEQLAKDTSLQLKNMMLIRLSSPDHRQNKLTRDRLGEEFLSALNTFQDTQRLAAKINADETKRIKSQHVYIGDPFALGSQKNQSLEMESTNARMQEQMQFDESELRRLEMLEPEALQLEHNISSLNELFKEFAAMVYDEGEIVDSIEASIDRTCGYVESGTQQLQQAATYQNKSRKKKFIFLLILVIIIALIVIIICSR